MSPAPAPGPDEAFRVRCFHYGRVFVAMGDDAWPMRRFLVDVAWAMNGFDVAQRSDLIFDWPQPGAVADGGGKAFTAFFRHQVRTREDVRPLIAGGKVAALLGLPVPNESCIVEDRLYVHPGASDAASKLELWRLVRQLDSER